MQIINFDAIAVFGGGLKEVAEADVGTDEAVAAVALGLALMLSVYYGPAFVVIVSPVRGREFLQKMADWIVSHARPLEIGTGGILGVVFLLKGLEVLL